MSTIDLDDFRTYLQECGVFEATIRSYIVHARKILSGVLPTPEELRSTSCVHRAAYRHLATFAARSGIVLPPAPDMRKMRKLRTLEARLKSQEEEAREATEMLAASYTRKPKLLTHLFITCSISPEADWSEITRGESGQYAYKGNALPLEDTERALHLWAEMQQSSHALPTAGPFWPETPDVKKAVLKNVAITWISKKLSS